MPKRKSVKPDDGIGLAYTERQRVNRIIAMVCDMYKVQPEDLCTTSRYRHVVEPRQLAMLIIRYAGRISYDTIGQIFGRTHGTVYISCLTAYNQITMDRDLRERINPILTELQITIPNA